MLQARQKDEKTKKLKNEKTKRPKNGKTLKRVAKRTNKTQELPKEIFGQMVNINLLAQAARVYRNNQSRSTGKTKTRAEVNLTKKKLYRQKGTGRARHGAKSAPIFVGGGVAHGPKGLKVNLRLPKKMGRLALVSALSAKAKDGQIKVFEVGKIKKSREARESLERAGLSLEKKVTLVVDRENKNLIDASRNIGKVNINYADQINAYDVLVGGTLVFTKEGLDSLVKRVRGKL